MKENLVQRELMIRYLLNDLSRVEELQIEESYFTNSAFLRELLAARNELISSYVRGTLNKHDEALFEKLLQSSLSMQEKVNSFRAFLQSIDAINEERPNEAPRASAQPVSANPAQNASWFKAWLPDLRNLAWAAGALTISAGVLFCIGYFNQPSLKLPAPGDRSPAIGEVLSSDKRALAGDLPESRSTKSGEKQAPAETGEGLARSLPLSAQSAGVAKPAPRIKTVFLSAPAIRSSETDPVTLEVPAGVNLVRLYLEVDEAIPARYEAILLGGRTAPRTLWQKKGLFSRGRISPMVVCDLPVSRLENGVLVLRLLPQHGVDGGEREYNLHVILPGPKF